MKTRNTTSSSTIASDVGLNERIATSDQHERVVTHCNECERRRRVESDCVTSGLAVRLVDTLRASTQLTHAKSQQGVDAILRMVADSVPHLLPLSDALMQDLHRKASPSTHTEPFEL